MVFASLTFLLLFLPLTLMVFYLVPTRFRNFVLLGSSVVFYFWGGGIRDTAILLMIATTDFFIAQQMMKSPRPKLWLYGAITWNLFILCFFKYSGFLLGLLYTVYPDPNIETLFHHAKAITLPLGISFFVFETISYLVDVKNGTTKPASSWKDYAMYLTFFPHLVAGPIYRYSEIVPDLDSSRRKVGVQAIAHGVFLFSFGLAKKCLIANPMAQLADTAYALPKLSTFEAWIGTLAYTFQIYFDFSGYSTMAIGLATLVGFHLPLNFNEPYTAISITDFWRRWHISLSRWFRDYLYIPLGGNREGNARTYFNLTLVFLLCGLWHGASFTFVMWGAYHGLCLVIERIGISPLSWERVPVLLKRPLTLVFVMVGWILFRSENFAQAQKVYTGFFGLSSSKTMPDVVLMLGEDKRLAITFLFAFLSLIPMKWVGRVTFDETRWHIPKTFAGILLLALCIIELTAGTFNPFIYYRF